MMGFTPSYADQDVWLHSSTHGAAMYDYVVIYVDNLFASMHDPGQFFTDLQSSTWNYKLKGVGEPCYHLGTDFFYDTDGTPCMGTLTYVKQLLANDEKLFDALP